MLLLAAEKLTKIHRQGKPDQIVALREIDIELERGSCLLLSGPSGSGKTTLLSLLACLARPTSGKYYFEGQQISSSSERFLNSFRKKNIGIVFQHFNLIETLTAEQNVMLPLLPDGLSSAELRKKTDAACKRVHISHKAKSLTSMLSGGEKQRIAIARALVSDPVLICADEPTAHLDKEAAIQILTEFELLKSQGKTIVITSHDPLVQQSSLIDKRIYLQSGSIVANQNK